MNCGIYIILNKTNNKVYVGSSVNISNRQYKHCWMLKKGIHDNIYLQKSFNKNGDDNFKFEILEYCEEKDLISRENHYINEYKSYEMDFGYNLALVSDSRRNVLTEKVKLKLSKYNQEKNGNFKSFFLVNLENGEQRIFDNLKDGAKYLLENGFTTGSERNVRAKLSVCLRNKLVDNGNKLTNTIRKTCYKHGFGIINN